MERAFVAACDLSVTKVLKQHWRQEKFSYLHKPRPDYGLMLLASGRIDFVTPGHTLHAQPGDIVFLPKGCCYEAIFLLSRGPVINYLINFDSSALAVQAETPCILRRNAAGCTEPFLHLVKEHRAQRLSPLRARGLLLLLLDTVFSSPAAVLPAALEQACALLQETEMPVCDIARCCSMSESGLRALFQAQLHTSPLQFRLQSRLERAAYLLESTDMTIGEIADQTHFYDAASFCRLFKRRYEQTPRQYAQSKRL